MKHYSFKPEPWNPKPIPYKPENRLISHLAKSFIEWAVIGIILGLVIINIF